jgi:hypothetical protein
MLFHMTDADQPSDVRWKTPIGPTIVISREGPPLSSRALRAKQKLCTPSTTRGGAYWRRVPMRFAYLSLKIADLL